jgi:hypothetical protein
MNAPTRPVLRYHGGKWRLAPWIIANLPAHRTYVEYLTLTFTRSALFSGRVRTIPEIVERFQKLYPHFDLATRFADVGRVEA